jgi:hypothetical protein
MEYPRRTVSHFFFRHMIDVRVEPPGIMEDNEGRNSDETINKIVWGVIYFICFLAAVSPVLDFLSFLS